MYDLEGTGLRHASGVLDVYTGIESSELQVTYKRSDGCVSNTALFPGTAAGEWSVPVEGL